MSVPKRGEVWLSDLGEQRGHEQAGSRPVVTLQTDALSHLSTVVIVPLTTRPNRPSSATNVSIPRGHTGLDRDSVALCHQIRALDRTRLSGRIGELAAPTLSEIEAAIEFLLHLPM